MEVYWVVGSGTNIGKTTYAKHLIGLLNNRGRKAIGFKPFAGMFIRQGVERLLATSEQNQISFYGNDGEILCNASPLTRGRYYDLVVPFNFICLRDPSQALFLRVGSTELDSVRLYKTPLADRMYERPDFKALIDSARLPLSHATRLEVKAFPADVSPNAQHDCLEKLYTLLPDAIVMEGAGPFLPVFVNCPTANHVVLLHNEQVYFLPNLNFRAKLHNGHAPTALELLQAVYNDRKSLIRAKINPIVPISQVDEAVIATLKSLLPSD